MSTTKRIRKLSELFDAIDRYTGGSSNPDWDYGKRDAVQMAEAEMNTRLRVPEMVLRAGGPVDQVWEGLPPNSESVIDLILIEESGKEHHLVRTGPQPITAPVGVPIAAYVKGYIIELYPGADADLNLQIRATYYGRVPDIWGDDPCHDLLLRHPDLYLFGSLANMTYFEDRPEGERAQYEAKFEKGMRVANRRMMHIDDRTASMGVMPI